MSLKNQEKEQSQFTQASPQQEDSYECNETISDISLEFNQPQRARQCQCTCRCKLKSSQLAGELQKKEKKRLKRKNNKMKLRNKQKEVQQKALVHLQQIIMDIYALNMNYQQVQKEVQAIIHIDINRDKFYDFINSIIRNQVEFIRQGIADDLAHLASTKQAFHPQLIKSLFHKIRVIREASPQIQKIINLFVDTHFNPQTQDAPYQRNLDELTYSFLIKNYLQKSVINLETKESFVFLCELIFEKEEYAQERALFQTMINAYNRYDPQESESEEEYSDSGYDSQEWDDDVAKRSINLSQQQENESKSRRRRERRRRNKQQHEQNYESIVKRMESMNLNELQRVNCNVEEDWIEDIIKKREQFAKNHKNSFNVQ